MSTLSITPFAAWAEGYGRIRHTEETLQRVDALRQRLEAENRAAAQRLVEVLYAADRVVSAGMWLVIHQTYADRVYPDGRDLSPDDFKERPEGHTGGSLNMVPAYVGYMAANSVSQFTRSWLMGQGHCVSAIDSVNLLLNNMTPEHAARYSLTEEGLTRFVRDFYNARLKPGGEPESPLGSHVNVHTAGGMMEGGYLGFAELYYVHMPLPGERLVAFLSDGAFEEQRGSDWAPRWWRDDDSGLVAPIMINNGRRIDQRTTVTMQGGADWLMEHLRLNGFDPFVFDGRDPAAFVWAILEMERKLQESAAAIREGRAEYPVKLPYGIAVAPKGAGFHNEGKNLAHNLPLEKNPRFDREAAASFNESAKRLFVPFAELRTALSVFADHALSGRPFERDHALANRDVRVKQFPPVPFKPLPRDRRDPGQWTKASAMSAIDTSFAHLTAANPDLRPRVGNPDEMKSNRMLETLDRLKFRVTAPEPGAPEDVHGAVITALNEEAVVCAALANKGGLNITVTYEAFGIKMHGAIRQEITFTAAQKRSGRSPGWLSVPLVLTSHSWENAKNEYSHQDPVMCEAMLNEHSDVSRVMFPADFNSAGACLRECYSTKAQLWTLVVPKSETPLLFSPEEAARMLRDGAVLVDWAGYDSGLVKLCLAAAGAYQFAQVLRASFRLADRRVGHRVVYLLEPARFRVPRTNQEAYHCAAPPLRNELFPDYADHRLFVSHTRPDVILGVLKPLNTGSKTSALGFSNAGGTLDLAGMLWVNRCSWIHIVAEAACLLGIPRTVVLDEREIEAIDGRIPPAEVFRV